MLKLFFSFDGRIGRARYWLGFLTWIGANVVLSALFGPDVPVDENGMPSVDAMVGPSPANVWSLTISLVMLYPLAALMVKRLKDRNRPPNPWLWLFVVPGVLFAFLRTYGIGFETVDVQGQAVPMPTGGTQLVLVSAIVSGLWSLIELGILRGTRGPNRYGPDPLD